MQNAVFYTVPVLNRKEVLIKRSRSFLGAMVPMVFAILTGCNSIADIEQTLDNTVDVATRKVGDISGLGSKSKSTQSSTTEEWRSTSGVCTSPRDREWVKKTQEDLAHLGYKPGAATGEMTPQTESALRDYLWHHGYKKWKLVTPGRSCNLATADGRGHVAVPKLDEYTESTDAANVANSGYRNMGKPPASFQIK